MSLEILWSSRVADAFPGIESTDESSFMGGKQIQQPGKHTFEEAENELR